MTQEIINQIAHFLAGALGIFGPIALFGKEKLYSRVLRYSIIGIILFAAIKEFGYDAWLGHTQPFLGATIDFGVFVAGISTAVVLSWMSIKWKWS